MIRTRWSAAAFSAFVLLGSACAGGAPTDSTVPNISLGPAPDPHPASSAVSRAEGLLADGHPAEAARVLEESLASSPNDPRAHLTLGIARTLLDDRVGAEAPFRRALELDASYVEAHNELGLLLRDLGRLDEAVVELTRTIELRADFYDGWYNLALTKDDAGDLQGADAAFTRAVEGLGEDPIVRVHRAALYLRMTRPNDTKRELIRARELASGRTDVLRAIARMFSQAGFADEAARTIERAVRSASEVRVDLLIEAAGLERAAREGAKALDFARRATTTDPTSARAFAMLGLVHAEAGRSVESNRALDRATELDVEGELREDIARIRALARASN